MPEPQPADNRRGLWIALGLTLLVRGAVLGAALWASPSKLGEDPDAYVQIGRHVVERGVYGVTPLHMLPPWMEHTFPPPEPTAIRTPLYPLAMAVCVAAAKGLSPGHEQVLLPWLIAVLHLVCGLATVWLTWQVAGLWGVRWRLLAALLVACDPLLVNQSTLVMTETVATLLAVVWLLAMTRLDSACSTPGSAIDRAALVAGLSTGLAALCRPTFLPLAGVVVAVLVSRAFVGRSSWRCVLVYSLGVAALVGPWVLRNQWQFGRPIAATTHGGYTLLLGNNERYYEHVRNQPDAVFDADDVNTGYYFRKMDIWVQSIEGKTTVPAEVAIDAEANEAAKNAIQADPLGCLLASVVRWQSLWRLVPLQTSPQAESGPRRWLRYLTGAWYGAEFILAVLGLIAVGSGLWRGSWRWGLWMLLVFMAVHSLYWTDMRMRAPLMPGIALAAAAGAQWLVAQLRRTSVDRL